MEKCMLCGNMLTTGEIGPLCYLCKAKQEFKEATKPMGWICPNCGASNSPYKEKCDCINKNTTYITTEY